jgi:hypothetical protein
MDSSALSGTSPNALYTGYKNRFIGLGKYLTENTTVGNDQAWRHIINLCVKVILFVRLLATIRMCPTDLSKIKPPILNYMKMCPVGLAAMVLDGRNRATSQNGPKMSR